MFVFQHPKICEFPSYEFYKGELITPDVKFPSWDDHFIPDGVWPNKSFPLVFCHVEGAERTLTVSTSDGNERSKSNIAERDHVVSNCLLHIFFKTLSAYLL